VNRFDSSIAHETVVFRTHLCIRGNNYGGLLVENVSLFKACVWCGCLFYMTLYWLSISRVTVVVGGGGGVVLSTYVYKRGPILVCWSKMIW